MDNIPKLSTGDDSTLGNYRKLAVALLGENTPATQFLDKKILDSPNGVNEIVVAIESLMLMVLINMCR